MKRTLAILTPFLFAWCPQAFPQDPPAIPTEVFKCSEGRQSRVPGWPECASGPSKPLKTHDAKGNRSAERARPEYVRPGPAPVAIIPYTPSKPLSYAPLPSGSAPAPAEARTVAPASPARSRKRGARRLKERLASMPF
jgi:hypothetical protein